ncbi:MAG: autotransporter, partial [Candidatus Aureabacteria bacterium]|nr:autotransporter [Candidatus Auribacterota bacterium]
MKAVKTAIVVAFLFPSFLAALAWAQAQPVGENAAQSDLADTEWPRQYASGENTVTLYQPQINTWEKNILDARMAVSVQTAAAAQPTFGVVWITARTEVNKESGLVTLEDITIVKADFPQESGQSPDYLAIVSGCVTTADQVISLSRLQANLAVTQAEERTKGVAAPLKNDPPRIIFSSEPAVLVLVDGAPVLRPVEGTQLLRVINTRALILLDQTSGVYYLHLLGRWMGAAAIEGPWAPAPNPPASLAQAQEAAVAAKQVDLLDQQPGDQTAGSTVPTVYVSTVPAELLQTEGRPGFAPIDGTRLLTIKNTSSRIFLDLSSQRYYVLISGRWFRAPSLPGPWEYVPSGDLPPDFAKIPENHP